MNTNRRKQVNPVHLSSLIRWLLVAAFIGASGLFFVYIKNQQFALAEETRQVERRIANLRAPAADRRGLYFHEAHPGQRHCPPYASGTGPE